MNYNIVKFSAEEIQKNPSILNKSEIREVISDKFILSNVELTNTIIKDSYFDNAVFENVTFNKCTFDQIDFLHLNFKNIIFNDCTFINTHFILGSFTDVIFHGGKMTYRGNPESIKTPTRTDQISTNNVIFDSISLHNTNLNSMGGGNILLKNLNNNSFDSKRNLFISVSYSNLKIDNCTIIKKMGMNISNNVNAYIKNSTIDNSIIGPGEPSGSLYIENSKILNSTQIEISGNTIIKNSEINARFSGKGTLYIKDSHFNSDVEPIGLGGGRGSTFYLLGNKESIRLDVLGAGHVNLFDLTLEEPMFASAMRHNKLYGLMEDLNLRNVTIRGGDWKDFEMLGGQWENVKIYPKVQLRDTKLGKLKTHNLTFPEGNPWVGEAKGNLETSTTPFEWPEVHVPTLEEMGMADWEFPIPTGHKGAPGYQETKE